MKARDWRFFPCDLSDDEYVATMIALEAYSNRWPNTLQGKAARDTMLRIQEIEPVTVREVTATLSENIPRSRLGHDLFRSPVNAVVLLTCDHCGPPDRPKATCTLCSRPLTVVIREVKP